MAEGFDPFSAELVLEFEDTRYAGAQVVLRLDVEMGDLMALSAADTFDKEIEWFVEHNVLIRWNIAPGGNPWEPTGENFKRLPFPMVRQIISNYAREARGPGAPLGVPSSAGGSSPVGSTALAAASNRRQSTAKS